MADTKPSPGQDRGSRAKTINLKRYRAVEDAVIEELRKTHQLSNDDREDAFQRLMAGIRCALEFDPDAFAQACREKGAKQREWEREQSRATGLSINAIRDSKKRERVLHAASVAAARENRFKD